MAWTDVFAAGLGYLGSREADKRQTEQSRLDREAEDRRTNLLIDQSKKSRPFESAFAKVTEEGLLTQPGGESSAEAQKKRAFGDIGRADKYNALSAAGPTGRLTKDQADAFIADQTRDYRTATIDPLIDQLTKQNIRQFGGLQHSDQRRSAYEDLQPLLAQLETLGGGKHQRAFDLLNQQERERTSALRNELALNLPQAPGPGFISMPPASSAQNVIANTPIAAGVAPASPFASGAAAGQNLFAQLQMEASAEASERQTNKLIEALYGRQLPNQYAQQGAITVTPNTTSATFS